MIKKKVQKKTFQFLNEKILLLNTKKNSEIPNKLNSLRVELTFNVSIKERIPSLPIELSKIENKKK